MEQKITVCGKEYDIIRLLGKGKGGYSYLAERDGMTDLQNIIKLSPILFKSEGRRFEKDNTN